MKIESNIELKETDTKNRTCYYFDDIVSINDLDLDNWCTQSAVSYF